MVKKENMVAAREGLEQMGITYDEKSFFECVKEGNVEAVRLLLNAGMDPNTVDEFGRSALTLASSGKHSEIVKLLLSHGAQGDISAGDMKARDRAYFYNLKVKTPGIAIASLVLGILSVITCNIAGVGLVVGVVGLIVSILALRKIGIYQLKGKEFATAGLILSLIPIVFFIFQFFILSNK